ncbi:hypothetical protein AAC387_Pa07g0032 [Persea americana]
MSPKTRNGEGSSKAQSLPPALLKKLPPVPCHRRSGGRSGATSTEGPVTQMGSSSKQLWEKNKASVSPPRRDRAPSTEQDLRQVLNNKRRDQAYDEGSSSNHLNKDSKRPCQRPEDIDNLREWLDRQVKRTVRQNMKIVGFTQDRLDAYDTKDLGTSPFSQKIRSFSLREKFSVPRFVLYDGTSDPAAHLRHFTERMSV